MIYGASDFDNALFSLMAQAIRNRKNAYERGNSEGISYWRGYVNACNVMINESRKMRNAKELETVDR